MDLAETLTAAEVATLANDTPITVTWSGGNGPHAYYIAVDRWGHRYAAPTTDRADRMRFYNELTYVGQKSYHTNVWRRA